jgi:uncharacterized membrane protein YphA (DoxX/SURF4 family)
MASSGTYAIGPARESDQQPPAETPWSTARKVAFRFVFCYFAQYILFDFPYLIPVLTHRDASKIAALAEAPWLKIVPWISVHLLGFQVTGIGGTLDSSFYWVKKLGFVLFAVIITVVWSLLDRKRPGYEKLDGWLRLTLRLLLAYTLFSYGAAKVMPSQMPPPSLSRMIQPFGDLRPFHLLWSFMGFSTFYQVLCGVVEMVCGLLLLIPSTTMLGALLSLAALGQVILLNIGYDVFVKLIPMHLVLFALYLLTPYFARIMNFFIFNRAIVPERRTPLFRRRSLNQLVWGTQWALGLYVAIVDLSGSAAYTKSLRSLAANIPLYGIWTVDEFAVDGQVRPPLLTDNFRWQRVVVDSEFRTPGKTTVAFQEMNGEWFPYLATIDEHKGSIALKVMEPKEVAESTDYLNSPLATATPPGTADVSLSYTRPQPDALVLQGLFDGHQLRVTLKKDDRPFLLNAHKKRFVHESLYE